jgi:hypothetical protein
MRNISERESLILHLGRNHRSQRLQIVLFILCICFTFIPAQASSYLFANFDDLPESSLGHSFSDGGIGFSSLDQRLPGRTIVGNFGIVATTAILPGFSEPNFLTFGTFGVGISDGYAFGRFGSADINFQGTGTSASMDIFGSSNLSSNTLTLEAILGGNIVASDTVNFYGSSSATPVFRPLSISGIFDSLRLVASGPDENGTVIFGMDNVSITVVPEPPVSVFALCFGAAFYTFWKWKRERRDLLQ